MEFIDLKTQYAALRASIDARIRAVLEHGQYIMGPEVAEMDAVVVVAIIHSFKDRSRCWIPHE